MMQAKSFLDIKSINIPIPDKPEMVLVFDMAALELAPGVLPVTNIAVNLDTNISIGRNIFLRKPAYSLRIARELMRSFVFSLYIAFLLIFSLSSLAQGKPIVIDYCGDSDLFYEYFLQRSFLNDVLRKRQDEMSLMIGNVPDEFVIYVNKKALFLNEIAEFHVNLNKKENVNSVLFFTDNVKSFLERNKEGVMPFFVTEEIFNSRINNITSKTKIHYEVTFYQGSTSGVLGVARFDLNSSEKKEFIDDFFLFSLGLVPDHLLKIKYKINKDTKNTTGFSEYDIFFIKILYHQEYNKESYIEKENFIKKHKDYFYCRR